MTEISLKNGNIDQMSSHLYYDDFTMITAAR